MASPPLFDRIGRFLEGEVRADAPLAPWTSIRVGGPAELWVKPASIDALVTTLSLARSEGVPVHVLGGGANSLIGDGGIPGVTVKLPGDLFAEERQIRADDGLITLCAGAAIAKITNAMKALGLVGAEFLAGIPGTVGGAVTMNAGTRSGECMTVVDAVELATPDGVGWVDARELRYGYRHTVLPPGAVVTRARFRLPKGDVAESQRKMDEDLGYRKRTQPLSQPNCGSVFVNPRPHHAGALIEQVGLKGHRIGRAQISTLHANWIVNLGGATALDVTSLMALAQRRVFERFGVELKAEVKKVGVFTPIPEE
ncbi:MAG: UDP-N-acetylmuramate dehydrogenase [Myxococcaceae bacterium]|nr:UDP-N-acetylmuramate dehydrogenase [Myxococcaceae bacterium]